MHLKHTMGRRESDNGLAILKGKIILLALVFLVLGDGVNGKRITVSTKKDLEVERKLKLMNKPAVKSIQSEDGDIIDCVDIHKQPAFDHPLLKNHKIQMKPNFNEQELKEEANSSSVISQLWRKSGSCPEGTIPIRRVRKSDVLRASSLEKFGTKSYHIMDPNPNDTRTDNAIVFADAILLTQGYRYNGVQARFNVWNPYVEEIEEYSSAEFWLRSGPYYDTDSLEAGWIVNPSVYGDKRTRLFTYWISNKTGCYDLFCSGFVQTSKDIALGGVIDPVSSGRQQYEIKLTVAWDPDTDSWWLVFGEGINVGYWPSSLFSYLYSAATTVFWGGEVYSKRLVTPHTRTAMGSGAFSGMRFGNAAYMGGLRIRDNSMVWKYPEWVATYQNQYNCYDTFNSKEGEIDPVFYFGGPGRSFSCP